ncbi:hypothetical protein [Andreprevotia sp. IGB-42]|uniref:hypothetical protein n=1 Tax=Andreprevotia sp. IGB-42 TaxID=2497473 RepID=UPI0013576A2D|nr:hypothetical protein [Andreprevotia sp. IGB-42]
MTCRNEVFDYETPGRSVSYWHAAAASLPYVLIDLLLLLATLRPRTYVLACDRALLALLLFSPYALINLLTVVHASGWHMMHALVLLGLLVYLALLLLNSLLARLALKADKKE